MFLIAPAYAQAAGAGAGEGIQAFLPLILIFVVFYFLLIRPQQKKMKQQRDMLSAIRRGDRVVTAGGIIGLVTKVNSEQEVIVEIADNVRVKVMRDTISTILAKTEPVSSGGKNRDEAVDTRDSTDPESSSALESPDQQRPKTQGAAFALKNLLSGKGK